MTNIKPKNFEDEAYEQIKTLSVEVDDLIGISTEVEQTDRDNILNVWLHKPDDWSGRDWIYEDHVGSMIHVIKNFDTFDRLEIESEEDKKIDEFGAEIYEFKVRVLKEEELKESKNKSLDNYGDQE